MSSSSSSHSPDDSEQSRPWRPTSARLSSEFEGDGQHSRRLEDHRRRSVAFEEKTQQLAAFLARPDYLVPVASVEALAEHHNIALCEAEYFSTAMQSNLPSFSILHRAKYVSTKKSLYAHVLLLRNLPVEAQSQLLNEALKIQKYFSEHRSSVICLSTSTSSTARSKSTSPFLRLVDIFFLEPEQRVLVVQEKLSLEYTLQHRIWSTAWNGYLKAPIVKQWAIQLAEALEYLNQSGVACRFLRPETVILSSSQLDRARPKVTSFDFACLYWDVESHATVPIHPRLLPLTLPAHLVDHLPPECFTPGYDASMVDVWSLGAIICLLMTGGSPFTVPDLANAETGLPCPLPDYIGAWKRSEARRTVPEEVRSLLDDIFSEADSRITVWEVGGDFRLSCKDTREFTKKKMPPYYRIDLNKNLNVDGPADGLRAPKTAPFVVIPASNFSANSGVIFHLESYQNIREGGESALANYRVLREASFTGDLGPALIVNDYYLKAVHFTEEAHLTDPPVANCLVKILPLRRIPLGYRNMLLNESTKILKHFSAFEPLCSHIHRVLDVYLLGDSYLYLFFEDLPRYKSVYTLMAGLSADYLFPPPSRDPNPVRMLTLAKLQLWMRNLAQTAAYLAHHGLAHRYIRPEYVFINEQDHSQVKLTHFDLACFAWNPDKSLLIKRTRAIQDKNDHLWDHLPPEAYEPLYDSLLVDVWSIGVLCVYCLTGEMPFTSPLTAGQAAQQWTDFQRAHATVFNNSLSKITHILAHIFVPGEERLQASQLVNCLAPPLSFGDLEQPNRRRPTDVTVAVTEQTKSAPKSADTFLAKASQCSRPSSRGGDSKSGVPVMMSKSELPKGSLTKTSKK